MCIAMMTHTLNVNSTSLIKIRDKGVNKHPNLMEFTYMKA